MSLDETIDSLDLNPKTAAALKKARITDQKHLLTLSNPDIERLTKLSSKDVQSLKDIIADRNIKNASCSALEILQNRVDPSLQHWRLSTNCEAIDKTLRGGLLSSVITEISGESACGKTQLCLQLCISVQLNEQHGGGAVYICTEDVFPSKRLQQIIHTYSTSAKGQNLGDKIFVEHVADFETLDFCVNKKLPALLSRGLVRLVIIDSVAALFRCHYDSTQTVERAKHLTRFASLLHQLAFRFSLPVVCVNQVSANFNGSASQGGVIPALGLTWANQVTCRIMLSRPHYLTPNNTNGGPTYRKLRVVFAPHLPQTEIDVYIDNSGIHGISTSGHELQAYTYSSHIST